MNIKIVNRRFRVTKRLTPTGEWIPQKRTFTTYYEAAQSIAESSKYGDIPIEWRVEDVPDDE